MQSEPMPWPLLLAFGLFWLYGLWPALKPDHFRQTAVRNFRPRSMGETLSPPSSVVQLFGIVWLILTGFAFVAGIWSRIAD